MTKFWNKHSKEIIMAVIVLLVVCIVVIVYEQKPFASLSSIEEEIPNEPRSTDVLTDTFYSDQLTDLERENYQLLEERMQAKAGGVFEFTEALTGEEYLRITAAVTYQSGNYYYGLIDIPMNKKNVCVSYNADLSEVTDSVITKCIVFISAAEGINEQGEYGDDGTVTNLDRIAKDLSVNDDTKIKAIEQKEADTEKVITEIIDGISGEYGEKETVDYFLKWMDENLTYNTKLSSQVSSYKTMEEMMDGAYTNVNTVCVVDGKATALGYVKLLSELCNRSGMESHIVMGAWGNSGKSAYALCEITLGGEHIYVDASGNQSSDLSKQRYVSEEKAKKKMSFTTYFKYSN